MINFNTINKQLDSTLTFFCLVIINTQSLFILSLSLIAIDYISALFIRSESKKLVRSDSLLNNKVKWNLLLTMRAYSNQKIIQEYINK